MNATILPYRAKRCDTRALELIRAEVKADLMASKAVKESLFLQIIVTAARIYIAVAWALMLAVLCMATLVLPAYGIYWVAAHCVRLK